MARKATDDSLLLWVVHDNLITVREFGEFIIIALFHNTPLWVIVLLRCYCSFYHLPRRGGRYWTFKEIIGPIVLLMITFVIILNVGNMNWDYMRPIYHDSGWLPILKGSYTPVAAFWRGCYDDDVRFLYG